MSDMNDMTEIIICIGSACHVRGARELVAKMEQLIETSNLSDKIFLKGSFCMGNCSAEGVSVKIGDLLFYVKPENAEQFFQDEVLPRLER